MTKNKIYKTIRFMANLYSVSGSKNAKCSMNDTSYTSYTGSYDLSMSYSGELSGHKSYSGRIENAMGHSASGCRDWKLI